MSQLDQLNQTLKSRLSDGSLALKATDLSGDSKTQWTNLIGAQWPLTGASVGDIANNKFTVTGQGSLWNVTKAFTINFVSVEDAVAFEVLSGDLPASWHFSESFSDLSGSFLDYIKLSKAQLIATSFDHAITTPAISLKSGLNFYGQSDASQALKSVKALDPSITSLTLAGTIVVNEGKTSVDLQSSVADFAPTLSTPSIKLTVDPTKPQGETDVAQLVGTLQATDFNFPYSFEVPTVQGPLAQLYFTLLNRLSDGNLTFKASDLGTTTSPVFSSTVGADELSLTSATVTKTDDVLTVKGQVDIFQLEATTPITIDIVEESGELQFTLSPDALPSDWNLSSSFSQLDKTFFDGIVWQSKFLIATSYVHQITSPTSAQLAVGLNFVGETSASGVFAILADLPGSYDSIPLQGLITKSETKYTIDLNASFSEDMPLALIGFEAITLKNPITFDLYSHPGSGDAPDQNGARFSGTLSAGDLSYKAYLEVPVNADQWVLIKDATLDIDNPTKALALSSGVALSQYFPTDFLSLNSLSVDELTFKFLLKEIKRAASYIKFTLKDDDSGQSRKYVVLSNPNIAIDNLGVGFIFNYTQGSGSDNNLAFTGIFSGDIAIGSATNLTIQLIVSLGGTWVISITANTLPTLDDLAAFIWPGEGKNKSAITGALPDGLVKGSLAVKLAKINLGFNPLTPQFQYVTFNLEQTGTWDPLGNGKLTLSDWSIALKVDATKQNEITGLLNGSVQIGSVADIAINLPIPAGSEGWTISLNEGTVIRFPSLGEILTLTGNASTAVGLPEGVSNIGKSVISILTINFEPKPAKLKSFAFGMDSDGAWTIIPSVLSIDKASVNVQVTNEGSTYETIGYVQGLVSIFNKSVLVVASRGTTSDPWKLALSTRDTIHIPGLKDLAGWMLPGDMVTYIPEAFMPFGAGFDLQTLNMDFDLTSKKLNQITFNILNSQPWKAIPTYLTLDDVIVAATIGRASDALSLTKAHIAAKFEVGSAIINFTADKSEPAANWVLTGSLANEVTLDFSSLLEKLQLSSKFKIPTEDWLPAVSVTTLNMSTTPQEGIYHFDGTADVSWNIPFLDIQFPLKTLGGIIDFTYQKDTPDSNSFSATIFGKLQFSSIEANLGLTLDNKGTNLIFSSTITPTDSQNISMSQVGDSMVSGEGNTWSDLTPTDLDNSKIKFASSYIYFNQADSKFFLYGGLSNFGDAIYLSKNAGTDANPEKGYLFAFALADGFRFSNLFSSLSIIDDILTIDKASLLMTSFQITSASALKTEVDAIVEISTKPGAITSPITVSQLPSGALEPGMHIYAALSFGSTLFSRILQLQQTSDAPDVTIYASITKDSTKSVFKAEFAEFSMFGAVTFGGADAGKGVALTYSPGNKNQFTLAGKITFTLFSNDYAFIGNLVSDTEKTSFSVTTANQQTIPSPFGLPPAMTINELVLDVIYTYADSTDEGSTPAPSSVDLKIGGNVNILDTVGFVSTFYVINNKPVYLEVAATQDLPIGKFFNKLIPGGAWPTEYFDITFKNGKIYYYKSANDTSNPKRFPDKTDGFNISSIVELYIVKAIDIPVSANINSKGIKLSAGLPAQIDFGFLKIASPTKSGSTYTGVPVLYIDTQAANTTFGLRAGFNFFQEAFGDIDVNLRKQQNELLVSGTLESAQPADQFGQLSVGFTYSKSQGFKITNWPAFNMVTDAIDFVKKMKGLYSGAGGPCKALVDFITDKAFRTKFKVTPSVTTSGGQLTFVMTGSYQVYVIGVGDPIVDVAFPGQLKFLIPNTLKFSELWGKLLDSVEGAAEEFVKGILNDKEQLEKFMAAVFGTELAKTFIAQFLC
ncbi:MAG: hypothetical protein KI790_12540, partial [Cyclobacteriaceae bacterium]|nr:hypothetical protein [Cyclobacteriaceae bacterium HetDA_MAG_MS6]